MKNLLKIENITKEYNVAGKAVVALNNLALEVNHGDCIAIVGESGSGKTTLARMILGLEYPTAGNIIFDEISEALKNEMKYEIRGYGIFKVKHREARIAKNPKTGEKVHTPEKKTIHFKMAKDLFKKLNDEK